MFSQGLLMTVITAVVTRLIMPAIQVAAAATTTTPLPHIMPRLPEYPQISSILKYTQPGPEPITDDPQFLNLVRKLANAQIEQWASDHLERKMFENAQRYYKGHHHPYAQLPYVPPY